MTLYRICFFVSALVMGAGLVLVDKAVAEDAMPPEMQFCYESDEPLDAAVAGQGWHKVADDAIGDTEIRAYAAMQLIGGMRGQPTTPDSIAQVWHKTLETASMLAQMAASPTKGMTMSFYRRDDGPEVLRVMINDNDVLKMRDCYLITTAVAAEAHSYPMPAANTDPARPIALADEGHNLDGQEIKGRYGVFAFNRQQINDAIGEPFPYDVGYWVMRVKNK